MAGCLAKSTVIGWRKYYGGGWLGVDKHLCGAQQTRGFDPMLFKYCPPPPHQRPWTNIETTLGQVLMFPERAVGILMHACRLCLVGTGYTELCVCTVLFCSPSLFSVLFCSVLFCSVLFCHVLSCPLLFSSLLFSSLLFSSLLFSSLLFSSLLFSDSGSTSHRVIWDQTRYPSTTNAKPCVY